MTKQSYGNGDCINFVYDSLDRMTEKSYNDKNGNTVAKKQYLYGNDGNISLTVDYATNSYTRYNYDLSGRTASVREYSGTDISSNTPISYTEYGYADKTNYLTNVKHFSMLGTQNISYKYGNVAIGEMPDQVYSVSWNGKTKVTNGYDSLSRLTARTVNGLATNYTYKDISADKTTTLVKSVETSGIKHEYEYDALGNITSIYDGSRTTTYEYDELNQLTRVNDPYENKTHIYSYLNGNITEDNVYEYTTDNTPANLQYTVKYFYENSVWADVLTGVQTVYPENGVNALSLEQENIPKNVTKLLGNNAVRYDMSSRLSGNNGIAVLNENEDLSVVTSDTIGNITSYNGSTYTWLGRQLQSVSNDEMTTTFSYNSDGQRIGKKISISGDSEYDYSYYYNGDILAGYKLVISDSNGSSSLHTVTFMYDENGDAFGLNYNGNDYYYVRNAQNDIVFITDSANNGVVMYQYDAWGNITTCYDTSDDGMLSIINPYTYRGYFYEIETATYFLKSRYYNPQLHRFICADDSDVLFYTPDDVTDKNLFAYCDNNPINFIDVNGHLIMGILLVVAVVGGIVLLSGCTRNENINDAQPTQPQAPSAIPTAPSTSSSKGTVTAQEKSYAATVYAEAGGQNKKTKQSVAHVMHNRVGSRKDWQNIEDVLSAKGQFNGYGNKNYNYAMEYYNTGSCDNELKKASLDECLEVVIPIYHGEEYDFTRGAMYFHSLKSPDDWAYNDDYTLIDIPGTEGFWFYR